MAVYRRKGSPFWWYGFQVNGRRVQASTKETSKRLAQEVERYERYTIAAGIDDERAALRRRLKRSVHPELTHLYRYFGEDDQLLYIGVSNDAIERWRSHKRRRTWVDEVLTVTIQHFPTLKEAQRAEAAAIIAEKPLYNRQVRLFPEPDIMEEVVEDVTSEDA